MIRVCVKNHPSELGIMCKKILSTPMKTLGI